MAGKLGFGDQGSGSWFAVPECECGGTDNGSEDCRDENELAVHEWRFDTGRVKKFQLDRTECTTTRVHHSPNS